MRLDHLIIVILYLATVIIIGAKSLIMNKTSDHFLFGASKMKGFSAAISTEASDMSCWVFMGLPGYIYAYGAGKVWMAVGLLIGTIASWGFCSGRVMHFAGHMKSYTLPDFLSKRVAEKKNGTRMTASVLILLYLMVYLAASFSACATFFVRLSNDHFTYHQSLVIGTAVILLYTYVGGFTAVCLTDLLQGIIMLGGLIIVPFLVLYHFDVHQIVPNLVRSGLDTSASDYLNASLSSGLPIEPRDVLSQLSWGLGYFGMPHIVMRFMVIRDEYALRKSRRLAIVWVLAALSGAVILGVVGRFYLYPKVLSAGYDYENVYMEVVKKLFGTDIAVPFVGGIFACALLSAIMSSADSQLLAATSAAVKDCLHGIFFKNWKDHKVLDASRLAVSAIAIVSALSVWNHQVSVMQLVSLAWAGLGATLGPSVLLALYFKRCRSEGMIAGMITGAVTVAVWNFVKLVFVSGEAYTLYEYTGVYALPVGFFANLFVAVVVSLIAGRNKVGEDKFEEIMQEWI